MRLARRVPFLTELGAAFALTAVAELGDKTQLIVLALAARGHRLQILGGAAAAFALLVVAAVLAADIIARVLPPQVLLVGAALLFVAFGVWTLIETWRDADEEDDDAAPPGARAPFLSAFALIGVAELGDKTQLGAAGLVAAGLHPVAVGLGAFIALVAVTALAVLLGGALGRRLRPRVVQTAAGVLFVATGAVLLVLALV